MTLQISKPENDPRWARVVARDADADGKFYYSVKTMGVYCRPSCPSRLARPENVTFHATCDEAEKSGFRPCKRCKPRNKPVHIRFEISECSLGTVLIAGTARGVCAILLGDGPDLLERDLRDRFPQAMVIPGETGFMPQMVRFVNSHNAELEVDLDIHGTAFQQRVWQALREIPAGSTASYADIADRIGSPKSVRAVAQACGANPLAVAIPCHRVIRSDGSLSGYRWGIGRKELLLQREAGR